MNFLQTGYKGKNDAWMYVIMFFIVFIGSMIGQIPITVKAFFAADGDLQKFAKSGENSFADLGIDANLYLFLILLSFSFVFSAILRVPDEYPTIQSGIGPATLFNFREN